MAIESELLHLAERAARSAGRLLLEKWGRPFKVYPKGNWDLWIEADLQVQKKIVSLICAQYPDHGFLTEEPDPDLPSTRDITWIIDPIDGSLNYSKGQPLFAVSIAAAIGESLVVGVVFDPCRDELFSAARGSGFFLNGRKKVAKWAETLESAVIGFDWGRTNAAREFTHRALSPVCKRVFALETLGSASLSLAWTAAGRIDGYFSYGLDTWDIAAGSVMLLEAGGQVIDRDGQPWDWCSSTKGCMAGGIPLCHELRKMLPG